MFRKVETHSSFLGVDALQPAQPRSQRLGLLSPSVVGFDLVAFAFLVHWAVKLERNQLVLQASASGYLSPVQELRIRLADLHYKDFCFPAMCQTHLELVIV